MKKIFTLFLALAASVGMMFAEKVKIGDLYYNLDATHQTAEVTSQEVYPAHNTNNYTGLEEIIVPSSIVYDDIEYSVIGIGERAFQNSISLKSVVLPNSIVSVSDWAFYGSGLTNPVYNSHIFAYLPSGYSGDYILPYGIVRIAETALGECPNLTSVTIPNTVTQIGWGAFMNDSQLTSIILPPNLETLGMWAFAGCTNISSITCKALEIPIRDDNMSPAPDNIFWQVNTSIPVYVPAESIELYRTAKYWGNFENILPLPDKCISSIGTFGAEGDNLTWELSCDSVLTISGFGEMGDHDEYPWSEYKDKIKKVLIEPYVTSIGRYAFYGCTNLDSVSIGSGVSKIANFAFHSCKNLKSVVFPNSIVDIGINVFGECKSITTPIYNARIFAFMPETFSGEYSVPEGIEIIAGCAFAYSRDLNSVIIPNSVTYIGNSAFYWCNLENISMGDNVVAIGPGAFFGCSFKSIVLPNSLTQLEGYNDVSIGGPFSYCKKLTSIIIPNNVTSIGIMSFYRCADLTSVIIGESVRKIERRAFCECSNLKSIVIPNGVEEIGAYVFQDDSNLVSVTIGSAVTSIEYQAFKNCISLDTIFNLALSPQEIDNTVFDGVDKSLCKLFVDGRSLNLYKTAEQWKDFENILPIPGTEVDIEEVNINYLNKAGGVINKERVALTLPIAPQIDGFTFLKWEVVQGDLSDGINIQAIYTANVPTSAPAVYTNPANPAQKLIRNGSVYILTEDKAYTITGQTVK